MTLEEILTLEPRAGDGFIGHSPIDHRGRVYGGLVVAQALTAAYGTVEGRPCHSLHCYFLRMGDPAQPIDYAVERLRDGAGFSVRRVTATQGLRTIFALMASFQRDEPGPSHQLPVPEAAAPEDLPDEMQRWLAMGDAAPEGARRFAASPQRIEMRWSGPPAFETPDGGPTSKAVWMRCRDPLPGAGPMQLAALAYASDMTFISTALGVHGLGFWKPGVQTASLDHAIWFHRPTDFNEWHLYVQESPFTGGARGFVHGRMFRRDGTLVASMTQEGLIRVKG